MGLFSWIRDLFSGGGEPEPPTASPPDGGPVDLGTPDDGGFFAPGDQDLPYRDTVPFDFQIAGFLPLEGDFNADYVDTEGQAVDVTYDIEWADVDYVVVKIVEPGGNSYYTTFVGPFDDYDDFFLDLVAWWEEGSV